MMHRPGTEPVLSKYHLVLFLGAVRFVSVVEVKSVPIRFYQCQYYFILLYH